jgi:Peptidase A4 family
VELYPAPSHDIIYTSSGSDVPVHPGDKMTSSVQVIGDGYYAIKLADHTRGWNYSQSLLDLAGRNASAEAITEAPASAATGNILPLADSGSVYFTRVNLAGHAKRTTMVARNWKVKASVTGPQSDFAVHFKFAGLFPASLT